MTRQAAKILWNSAYEDLRTSRYWHAHEHIEAIWRAMPDGAPRDRVRATIQVCAAAHKLNEPPRAGINRRAGALRVVARAEQNAGTADDDPLHHWLERAVFSLRNEREPHFGPLPMNPTFLAGFPV